MRPKAGTGVGATSVLPEPGRTHPAHVSSNGKSAPLAPQRASRAVRAACYESDSFGVVPRTADVAVSPVWASRHRRADAPTRRQTLAQRQASFRNGASPRPLRRPPFQNISAAPACVAKTPDAICLLVATRSARRIAVNVSADVVVAGLARLIVPPAVQNIAHAPSLPAGLGSRQGSSSQVRYR